MSAPRISVIVPVPPGRQPTVAIEGLRALRAPEGALELLVVEGRNPSAQRNAAAAQARGELLWFLDDDTRLDPRALERALECLEAPEPFACVGGPVMTARGAPPFQKAVGAAMGSVFGLGPARHRHVPYGPVRQATELDLLSANLLMTRAAFEAVGGFDERLYPNEENELLKRMVVTGHRCAYHPLMCAHRARRPHLLGVFWQNLRYGMGRMAHLFQGPRPLELLFLAPLALVLSLALALAWPHPVTLLPPAFYAAVGLAAATMTGLASGRPLRTFAYLLLIFPTMHLAYGLGSLLGLLRLALPRRERGAGEAPVVRSVELSRPS